MRLTVSIGIQENVHDSFEITRLFMFMKQIPSFVVQAPDEIDVGSALN